MPDIIFYVKGKNNKNKSNPDRCGSTCWASSHKVKDLWFCPAQDTCLSCRPGSQVEVGEGQPMDVSHAHQCFSVSLSASLPLSLKTNKY